MGGTKSGGIAAAKTNKAKYGEDFYAKIGAIGGKLGTTGGFYDRELAAKAGAKGGTISKRGKTVKSAVEPTASKKPTIIERLLKRRTYER